MIRDSINRQAFVKPATKLHVSHLTNFFNQMSKYKLEVVQNIRHEELSKWAANYVLKLAHVTSIISTPLQTLFTPWEVLSLRMEI
jgi:hypothetical protein